MNTILISGSAKSNADNTVRYDVYIWASQAGEPIHVVNPIKLDCDSHSDLWKAAKEIVAAYKENAKFYDGAYTQFLEHLILL